ncbi:class I SAM-dependent DNA methyltransferase [uncultured Gilvimarinus sp.]|uniref:type I restriction-modification system subunit M n=1 Tax=uncultured Gilvimarinus sp. TaxID=1689143 RepID=UPI0030D6E6B8
MADASNSEQKIDEKPKKAPKKASKAKKATKTFEQTLWDTADKLRGSVESSEYKHVVLSLIFLKFISDKFELRKQALIAEGQGDYIDMVEFYTMQNVFYLPAEARWDYISQHAKQDDIAVKIDTALHTVEKNNKTLQGALPDNYFSRLGLDVNKLAALIDSINNIDTIVKEDAEAHHKDRATSEIDIVGRVYEYFLGNFAATEGKGGGEFYTPKCIVNLLAEMLEPYHGKIYDPCCGSGGMFVQSVKFIENHQGNKKDISIYGQEQTGTTYKLAKMNLAIRGIAGNLGEVPADTFFKDQHPDLKADFIMANPPFNLKAWRGPDELTDDPRWAGYEVPPTGNANYGWILHMISKLSENGMAGFVLANGSMSTNTKGEGEIRKKIIENDLVDCMIALPGQLFYTTQIPVCLWFIAKNKNAQTFSDGRNPLRDRRGETLFIDARNMGSMVSRIHKELTVEDIGKIAETYHTWRNESSDVGRQTSDAKESPADPEWRESIEKLGGTTPELTEEDAYQDVAGFATAKNGGSADHAGAIIGQVSAYKDVAGFCRSASLDDIKANDYVLTPGRYVGAAEVEDDGEVFEEKMRELTQTLYRQMKESEALDAVIKKNLEGLGYGE